MQSHYGQQGNFELVCVLESGEMQHFWRDNDNGMAWNAGDTFGSGVFSTPCMIEGQNSGASDEKHVGNFELCVAVDGAVQHWWRDNQNNTGWQYEIPSDTMFKPLQPLLKVAFFLTWKSLFCVQTNSYNTIGVMALGGMKGRSSAAPPDCAFCDIIKWSHQSQQDTY